MSKQTTENPLPTDIGTFHVEDPLTRYLLTRIGSIPADSDSAVTELTADQEARLVEIRERNREINAVKAQVEAAYTENPNIAEADIDQWFANADLVDEELLNVAKTTLTMLQHFA